MRLDELTKMQLFDIFGVNEATTFPVVLDTPTDITLEWGGVAHKLMTLRPEGDDGRDWLINWTEENEKEIPRPWTFIRFD